MKVDVHRANSVGHQPPNHLTMGVRKSVLADQRKPPMHSRLEHNVVPLGMKRGLIPLGPHPTARAAWTLHKLHSHNLRPFQAIFFYKFTKYWKLSGFLLYITINKLGDFDLTSIVQFY